MSTQRACPVLSQGLNIGGWLYHDMPFETRAAFITAGDMQRIVDWGFDHVRLSLHENVFWDETDAPIIPAFDLLTSSIQKFLDANLDVVVDVHILRSHHFGQKDEPALYGDAAAQEQFVKLWLDLADALRPFPNDRLAYEILNEPVARTAARWNRVAGQVHTALRRMEPERTIVLGSNRQQSPHTFHELDVPRDPNLILDVHMYEPNLVTHYRAPWLPQGKLPLKVKYPGRPLNLPPWLYQAIVKIIPGFSPLERAIALDENRVYDRGAMDEVLAQPLAVAQRAGVPLHCGEFGVIDLLPLTTAETWLRDVLSCFAAHNVGWTYWCYGKGDRFSLVDTDGSPTPISAVLERCMARQ